MAHYQKTREPKEKPKAKPEGKAKSFTRYENFEKVVGKISWEPPKLSSQCDGLTNGPKEGYTIKDSFMVNTSDYDNIRNGMIGREVK